MIGKIQRVPLREVWRHEAYHFTAWLQDNLDVLNALIDLTLATAEREQAAGTFSVDLVAEDQSGGTVIIENQLEKSDHDHLGKLLTYLVAVDAQAAIWIVADPRPEHVSVINWLNETAAADFYLLKVEAIRIDSSNPAPLLTLIVGPSPEARQVGETKKELAERHHIRRDFWRALLDRAQQKTRLHANISASTDNWISATAGRGGLAFSYVVLQHENRVELNIDTGNAERNKQLFKHFYAARESIEQAFGEALEWDYVESRRKCHIRIQRTSGGYRDEARWPEIQEQMIADMVKLEETLRPYIHQL